VTLPLICAQGDAGRTANNPQRVGDLDMTRRLTNQSGKAPHQPLIDEECQSQSAIASAYDKWWICLVESKASGSQTLDSEL
jgi:hypothetical protein